MKSAWMTKKDKSEYIQKVCRLFWPIDKNKYSEKTLVRYREGNLKIQKYLDNLLKVETKD